MGVKKGDILPRRPLAERFWEKVDSSGGLEACWTWKGATRHWGYGCIWSGGGHGKILVAHRVAWELTCGPIPEGMCLDHICKNPKCVNPSHLRVVTYYENYVDYSDSPFAKNATKTHCKRGHEFSRENTAMVWRLFRRGKTGNWCRFCLTCFPQYWRHAIVPRSPPPGVIPRYRPAKKHVPPTESPATYTPKG